MTTPLLPARPQGIRTSPDGFTVAALYDFVDGPRWFAFTVDDLGVRQVALLTEPEVEGWVEWSPPPMEMPPSIGEHRAALPVQPKTVQDVVDGLPPGTEVT